MVKIVAASLNLAGKGIGPPKMEARFTIWYNSKQGQLSKYKYKAIKAVNGHECLPRPVVSYTLEFRSGIT